MDHAQTRLPNLSLDPKRIAATSVAIAVHVLVLMLLLLPTQVTSPTPVVDTPMIVTPNLIPIRPVTPPPRPLRPPVATPPQPTQPQLSPVDTTPRPNDTPLPPTVPDSEIVDDFQSPPDAAFDQISADISPPPPYPAQALRLRQSGVVTLKVRVDARGRPIDAAVETSSGSKLLDLAALKFVLARWHFIPATRDGVAIEAYALVPINFVIEK